MAAHLLRGILFWTNPARAAHVLCSRGCPLLGVPCLQRRSIIWGTVSACHLAVWAWHPHPDKAWACAAVDQHETDDDWQAGAALLRQRPDDVQKHRVSFLHWLAVCTCWRSSAAFSCRADRRRSTGARCACLSWRSFSAVSLRRLSMKLRTCPPNQQLYSPAGTCIHSQLAHSEQMRLLAAPANTLLSVSVCCSTYLLHTAAADRP